MTDFLKVRLFNDKEKIINISKIMWFDRYPFTDGEAVRFMMQDGIELIIAKGSVDNLPPQLGSCIYSLYLP